MEFSQISLINEKLDQIKKVIYYEKLPILTWDSCKYEYCDDLKYKKVSDNKKICIGDRWKCKFNESLFLKSKIKVPASMQGKRLVLELDLGGEGLVKINGESKGSIAFYYKPGHSALSGVIRPRTRIDVTDNAKKDTVYNIEIELNINYKDHYKSNRYLKYSDNIETEYILNYAYLCSVDENVEKYYFDVKNCLDQINLLYTPASFTLNKLQTCKLDLQFDRFLRNMNRDDGLRQKMIDCILKSFSLIPFFYTNEEIRKEIKKAQTIFDNEFKKLPRIERGKVFATGFSHVDLVWLWQEKHTIRKLANTFINAISLIERYPDFIFSFSQPYAFELLEKNYPELFTKIKKYVKEGRINLLGNLYVEMDTNLTGGEAMVRQLLYGREYYIKTFGKQSNIFFMPDSFGYSAALPQILKKSGIEYFFTDKLAAFNDSYRFPYTLFDWQGIDGTKIISYLERCSYNGCLNPERVDEAYHRNENKNNNDIAYVTAGYGDGGGGADYVMAENYLRLKNMPGLPKVEMKTLDEFFNTIKNKTLPIWNDELYLDSHRGTYTTHSDIKKNNRKAELLLRNIEIASWIRETKLNIKYPKNEIEKLWKILLPMQFHDALPGTCITQVYDDCNKKFNKLFVDGNKLLKNILDDISMNIKHKTNEKLIYNLLPWNRTEIISHNNVDYAVDLPSLGYNILKDNNNSQNLIAKKNLLENQYFKIKLNKNGDITSILYKENNREVIKKPSNIFRIYDDPSKPTLSAWDINIEYQNSYKNINELIDINVVCANKNKAVLRIKKKYHNSLINQDIIIYSNIKRIDFKTSVDWHEDMKLLKVDFYPNVYTNYASYEIQFGNIKRPTHRNTEYDQIRFEVCAHKWADMSQNDFGLSVLNDCKYGYDAFDGRMSLTLLRAPIEPDYKADRGINEFTYSLYPHVGNCLINTVRNGYELNIPSIVSTSKQIKNNIDTESFIEIDGDSVVLDSIKKAQDDKGYIFRFYEASGGSSKTKVKLTYSIKQVIECDLMEENIRTLPHSENEFEFETNPYGIYSFRVEAY